MTDARCFSHVEMMPFVVEVKVTNFGLPQAIRDILTTKKVMYSKF